MYNKTLVKVYVEISEMRQWCERVKSNLRVLGKYRKGEAGG